jgi:hypothetical protein
VTIGSPANPLQIYTTNADGSHDYHAFEAGMFLGVNYASYSSHVLANGFPQEVDYFDANGVTVAKRTFSPSGAWVGIVGAPAAPSQIFTHNADGSYDAHYFTPITYNGVIYASYDVAWNSAAVPQTETYYSSSGAPVVTVTLNGAPPQMARATDNAGAGGAPVSVAAFSDMPDPAASREAVAAPADKDAAAPTRPAPAIVDAQSLMLGATPTAPAGDLRKLFGLDSKAPQLAALLLGAVPLAALRGKAPADKRKASALATFDLVEDRFDAPQEDDALDLPLAGHSDQGAVDWIVME